MSNYFEKKLVKTIEEEIKRPLTTPEDDAEAFNNSFENEEDAVNFTTDPELPSSNEKYVEHVKEWQNHITEFLTWLNGTEGESLINELSLLERKYPGISKDSAKKISDVAQNLGALKEILVEIPRFITQQDREEY